MYKSKKQKGITLIALIITIIILLILVGVTINVFVGDNGLFNTTKQAGEEYTKSQLKEELEIEIANIQSKKIASGEEISREDLWELEKIGATMISVGTPAEGEYKDYNFTVDENYIVTIGEKSNIIKPEIQLTKNTEEIVEEVTIKVKVTTEIGTIISITKPDGTITTETEFEYKVRENKTYRFLAIGSNGAKSVASIEIANVKEIVAKPIIESNYGYPILTSKGIVNNGLTTITYDETKEGLENFYSINDGNTWIKYTGPFNTMQSTTIKAKSVKNGNIVSEASIEVSIPEDALGVLAYDGDETTYDGATGDDYYNRYLLVEPSVIGRNIKVIMKSWNPSWCVADGAFVLENGNIVSFGHITSGEFNSMVEIPENTVKIMFGVQKNTGIYEIQLVTMEPLIESNGYPILKSTGVSMNKNISITFDKEEGLENYYSIDNGATWSIYTGTFKVDTLDGIRAKSVKNGIILSESNKIIDSPSDALTIEAFDGDETTAIFGNVNDR